MPLSREDFVAILQHLRGVVRETLPGADDRVMADFGWEQGNPRGNLHGYLYRLEQLIALEGRSEAERTLRLLREYITDPNGRPLSEVRVLLSPAESEQYNAPFLSLLGSPEADVLLEQLRSLESEVFSEDNRTE